MLAKVKLKLDLILGISLKGYIIFLKGILNIKIGMNLFQTSKQKV